MSRRLFLTASFVAAAVGLTVWYFTTRSGWGDKASPSESAAPHPVAAPASGRGVYPFKRVVAVTVGINRYPNLVVPSDLRFAEADARAVGELFERHYGYEVVPLIGPQATRANIIDTVTRLGRELGDGDALVVYFAGHGQVVERPSHGEAGYLVPADARLDLSERVDGGRWSAEAIDMQWLTGEVERMSARHVLVIADACCSGFMVRRGSAASWDIKADLFGRSRTVMTATTSRQFAREDPLAGHGYFTAALLEALRRDDVASVLDVYGPVRKAVANKTHGNMKPLLAQVGDGEGMFVLVPQCVARSTLEADLSGRDLGPISPDDRGFKGAAARLRDLAAQRTTPADVAALLTATDYRYALAAEKLRPAWEEKLERFRRNAESGDVWAMAALHLCYNEGLASPRDPELAYHWARQAARSSSPKGLGAYLIGRCNLRGLIPGVKGAAARQSALRLYRDSAEAGLALGKRAYAVELLVGKPTETEARDAKRLLEEALAGGVPLAEDDLARMLEYGFPGVPRDIPCAVALWHKAAERESRDAFFALARAYSTGREGYPPQDLKKSEAYLWRGADLGDPEALMYLAGEYLWEHRRFGFPRDDRRAFELLDRAAIQRHAGGLHETAKLLAAGQGHSVDLAEARTRLEAAVELGDSEADLTQGTWYRQAVVYEQSSKQALVCFKRAADRGNVKGKLVVGRLYIDGEGVEVKDAVQLDAGFALHDESHRGFHYLMSALSAGVSDDEARYKAEAYLATLQSTLPGGTAQRRVQVSRARLVCVYWKRDYPESFQQFARVFGVDPEKMIVVSDKK